MTKVEAFRQKLFTPSVLVTVIISGVRRFFLLNMEVFFCPEKITN